MIRIAENADFNWIIRIAGRYVRFKTLHSRQNVSRKHRIADGYVIPVWQYDSISF